MTPREIFFDRIQGIHDRAADVLARLGIKDHYHYYRAELSRMEIPSEEADWNWIDRMSKPGGS